MDEEGTGDSSSAPALVPLREQVVDFYGDAIPGAVIATGEVYIPLRPLTDFLGLNFAPQRVRVLRDEVLAARIRMVVMARSDGRRVKMLCLPLDLLPGWLFGISIKAARPEVADKLKRYRAECFRVLWDAFKVDIMPAPAPVPADVSGAEQALMIAEAVASLAREHLALEQRHTTMADYMRGFVRQTASTLSDHAHRLQALEIRLASGETISEVEAQELQQAVKQVAMALHQQTGQQVSSAFQLVWGELYKRYRVGAYRNLPAAHYGDALAWLQGWYAELQKSKMV